MVDVKVFIIILGVISTCLAVDFMDEWNNHTKRVALRKYPCKEPLPKIMYFKEIAGPKRWPKFVNDVRDIRPFATVLHRCEGSGCCKKFDQRCQPKRIETVKLTFLVVPQSRYVQFEATNHTECACQKIDEELIK